MTAAGKIRWTMTFWIAMSLLLVAGVVGISYIIHMGGSSLPVEGQAVNFTATNLNGKTVSLSSLNGKIRLVTWFYTHCPDECPLTAFQMSQIQNQLETETQFGSKVAFISITIDPKRDTLPVIRKWADQFHPNFKDWYFLRATPQQTAQILSAYGVGLKQAANSEYIEHIVKTELIDQSGNVRVTYPSANLNVPGVLADIHNLISRESWT